MAVNQLDKEVGERLVEVINHLNTTSRQFALSLEMDPSQFAKITKGNAAISLEKLVEISSKHNISLVWLATGTGDMIMVENLELAEHQPPYGSKPGQKTFTIAEADLQTVAASLRIIQKALGLPYRADESFGGAPVEILPLGKRKDNGNDADSKGKQDNS